MEQACWHRGVGAAMGFCVVDWGGKDLGVGDLVVGGSVVEGDMGRSWAGWEACFERLGGG